MFTIQIVETSTGKPLEGKKVGIVFKGWLRGCTDDYYTNKDGELHFSEENGEGVVYVQGKKVYEGRIEGRKVIYI